MPDEGGGGALDPAIVEAIAISNAKSIAEQPAILANLALANQIANNNLAQQQALSQQQAMMNLTMATVSKCVEIISQIDPSKSGATEQISAIMNFMAALTKPASPSSGGTSPPPPAPSS